MDNHAISGDQCRVCLGGQVLRVSLADVCSILYEDNKDIEIENAEWLYVFVGQLISKSLHCMPCKRIYE